MADILQSTAAVIRGTLEPLLQGIDYTYDPENGFTVQSDYKGFNYARLKAFANSLEANRIGYQLSWKNGTGILTINDDRGEISIDTWQICQNECQKSCLENPRNIVAISPADIELIARAVHDGITIAEAASILEDETGDLYFPELQSDEARRLHERMLKGADTYAFSQYVLKHTTNVSSRYDGNIADDNVDCIYSNAQLFSEVQSGSLWAYPMPDRMRYKIQSISAPAVPSFYKWGWLKRGSTEQTAANNRINISTEYWLDLWSTDEYHPL